MGVVSCFLIISASAMKSAAAAMAEVAPMISQACHAGMLVSRYRSEPMRMNRAAEPASEIPSAIKTAPIMLIIRSLLMRCLKATSAWLAYSFSAALISFRIASIISLSDIFIDISFPSPKQTLCNFDGVFCCASVVASKTL